MSLRAHHGVTVAVGAVLLGVALGAVAARPSPAAIRPISVGVSDLLPGESRTVAQEFQVPTSRRVATTGWTARGVDARWDVRLCTSDGCTAWDELDGLTLPPATYELVATVHMPDDVAPGAVATAAGSISFTDASAPWDGGALADRSSVLGVVLLAGTVVVTVAVRARIERDPYGEESS